MVAVAYAPRPPVAHKLDPYKAIIDARLEAFPNRARRRELFLIEGEARRLGRVLDEAGTCEGRPPTRRDAAWVLNATYSSPCFGTSPLLSVRYSMAFESAEEVAEHLPRFIDSFSE